MPLWLCPSRPLQVSELVHKSSMFPSLDYARVAIYFQLILDDESSDEAFEVVPNSEFCISRVAYSNNTSKYTIDNRNSTFTEVGVLLRSHGVDLDNNRFLILQGEVEMIAMMKPKGASEHEEGLLEYLEDIIGSNSFVPRIATATKDLDAVNEQRNEKVHRLKIAEKERDALSGAKAEAEAFLDKEKALRSKKNSLYQAYAHMSQMSMTDLSGKLETVQGKLAQEKAKLSDSEDRLKTIQQDYETTKTEHSTLEAELTKASTQHDSFERKDVKLQEDLRHTKANLKKAQQALSKEEKKLADTTKEAEALQAQLTKTETLLADFTAKKAAAEDEIAALMSANSGATAPIRAELEAKQGALAAAEKAAGGLFTEKELLANQMAILSSRPQKAQQEIAALTAKVEALRADKAEYAAKVTSLTATMASSKTQLTALEAQRDKLLAQEGAAQEALYGLLGEIESAKEVLSASKMANGSDRTINAILSAARGSLSHLGIVGRLGDLAAMPAKYDIAVSTACKHLNHLVVRTTEDAQAIIAYLRENSLGRASFIVMDQLADQAHLKPYSTPAGVMRLFDLLQDMDASLRPAWYLALSNTLVADDLDAAVAVAYNTSSAVRVVTLGGQLIDASGAMSGGGEVRKGGMRLQGAKGKAAHSVQASSVTEAQVAAMEGTLAQKQADLSALQANRQGVEAQIASLGAAVRAHGNDLTKATASLRHLEGQEEEAGRRAVALQTQAAPTPEEVAQLSALEASIQQVEAAITAASPGLRGLQAEAATLQRSILSFGGMDMAKLTSRIDSLTAQIDSLASSLTGKKVDMGNLTKTITKAQQALDKGAQDIEKNTSKLQALEAEALEMSADASKVLALVEQYRTQLISLEEVLITKQAAYATLKGSVSKILQVQVDLASEAERLSASLKEDTASRAHYLKEVEAIRKAAREQAKDLKEAVHAAVPAAPGAMDVDEPADEVEELPDYTAEQLDVLDTDALKKDISVLEAESRRLKDTVSMAALMEYLRKDAAYRVRLGELEGITVIRQGLLADLEALRSARLTAFMQGFTSISLYLKEMYQMLTLGGDAELELIDSLDPFTEGIIFSVRPVKKSWKSILNLSGGEKTLASLALVFALHYFKPTPLYVMDEIDAALDFKNVSIVANYIKERTKNAQFIIISLRNNMFELADRLVGIYKTNDHTKSITISPKLFDTMGLGGGKEEDRGREVAGKPKRVPLGDATNKVH